VVLVQFGVQTGPEQVNVLPSFDVKNEGATQTGKTRDEQVNEP
jgi:hypothetical protein